MCFFISPQHPKAKIAEGDIVCYKALEWDSNIDTVNSDEELCITRTSIKNLVLKTPFRYSIVKLGTRFKSNLVVKDGTAIEEGLHTYKSLEALRRNFGFLSEGTLVVECIIPKGAMYFVNRTEYVSNVLVYPKYLNVWDEENKDLMIPINDKTVYKRLYGKELIKNEITFGK